MKLPTLHEILEQQKQVVPPDTIVPVAVSSTPVEPGNEQEAQPVQQPANNHPQETSTPVYNVAFAHSTNTVLRAAWEKALLQFFTTKISNK